MAVLTAGYWATTYYPDSYWADDYWPHWSASAQGGSVDTIVLMRDTDGTILMYNMSRRMFMRETDLTIECRTDA